MFIASYRWGVLPAVYLDLTPEWLHLATLEWLKLHRFHDVEYRRADPLRFELGEHYDDPALMERWAGKVAGAKYAVMGKDAGAARAVPADVSTLPPVERLPDGTFRPGEGLSRDPEGNVWRWNPPAAEVPEAEKRRREAALREKFKVARAEFEDPAMDPRNRPPEEE